MAGRRACWHLRTIRNAAYHRRTASCEKFSKLAIVRIASYAAKPFSRRNESEALPT
jgi:hypothetical protein